MAENSRAKWFNKITLATFTSPWLVAYLISYFKAALTIALTWSKGKAPGIACVLPWLFVTIAYGVPVAPEFVPSAESL